MRICRTSDDRYGLVDREDFIDVTAILQRAAASGAGTLRQTAVMALVADLRTVLEAAMQAGGREKLVDLALASPVPCPGKIVAAPVNYRKHLIEARADSEISFGRQVAEIREVGLFLKAPSSVIGPSSPVKLRHTDRRNDHEIELCVVIGKAADRVRREKALDHVAGYCIGLDMTLRGPEDRSFRKSIDSYTVLGPWMVTADEIADPARLSLRLAVNGEQRQRADVADLVLPVPELIEFASSFYTLQPGDVIMTGTPDGVGPVRPGDMIEAEITGIGSMRVAVEAA